TINFISQFLIETRSLPVLTRRYHRDQMQVRLGPFYVAYPHAPFLFPGVFFLLNSLDAKEEQTSKASRTNRSSRVRCARTWCLRHGVYSKRHPYYRIHGATRLLGSRSQRRQRPAHIQFWPRQRRGDQPRD